MVESVLNVEDVALNKSDLYKTTMRGQNIRYIIEKYKLNLQEIFNQKLKWKEMFEYSNNLFERLKTLTAKFNKRNILGISNLNIFQILDYLIHYDFNSVPNHSTPKLGSGYKDMNQVINEKKTEINTLYSKKSGPPSKLNQGNQFLQIKNAVNEELKERLKQRRVFIDNADNGILFLKLLIPKMK